ncbi:unnamed protein product, partial [Nesidiocoris tenuis]
MEVLCVIYAPLVFFLSQSFKLVENDNENDFTLVMQTTKRNQEFVYISLHPPRCLRLVSRTRHDGYNPRNVRLVRGTCNRLGNLDARCARISKTEPA